MRAVPWLRLGLHWALVAGALAQARPARHDQELLDEQRLVDHGWGFELVSPGEGWRLAEEAEAHRSRCGAQAGLVHDSGAVLLVFVRPPRGQDPAAAGRERAALLCPAREVRDGRPALPGTQTTWESSDQRGRQAWRVVGTVQVHRGFLLERVWSAPAEPGAPAPPWEAVRLQPGEALAGRGQRTTDVEGLGWRVREGVVESATMGLTVDARGSGLRLLVGSAARDLHSGCELALVDPERETQLVLLPLPPLRPAAAAAWLEAQRASRPADGPTLGEEEQRLAVGGQELLLRWARHEGVAGRPPSATAEGVANVASEARALLLFHADRAGPPAEEAVRAALATMRFVPEGRRDALEAALLRRPDPQGCLGPDWCYRDELFTHFRLDLTWRRPQGWRVSPEDRVRVRTGDPTLFWLEAPGSGLFASVRAQRPRVETPEAFHAWAQETLEASSVDAPREHRSPGGLVWRCSEWSDPAPLRNLGRHVPEGRALVATAVDGDRYLQVVVAGPADALEAARGAARTAPSLLAVLDAFTLAAEDLPDEEEDEGSGWRSRRFGVSLCAPGAGWRLLSPGPAAGRDRRVEARDEAGHRLLLLASGDAGEGGDPEQASLALLQALARDLDEEALRELTLEGGEKHALGEHRGLRLRAKLEEGRADLLLLHPRGRHVLLAVVDPDGQGPALGELQRALTLLP